MQPDTTPCRARSYTMDAHGLSQHILGNVACRSRAARRFLSLPSPGPRYRCPDQRRQLRSRRLKQGCGIKSVDLMERDIHVLTQTGNGRRRNRSGCDEIRARYHTARYVENTVTANKILTLGQHNGNWTGEFKVASEIYATNEELCRKLLYWGE